MTELLHKLVTVPILLPVILLSIMVGCIVLALLANHYDKSHNGKNPYVTTVIILLCLELVFLVGTKIRYDIVKSNIYNYVIIKKENDEIIVKSYSTFVKNKTFKIKETFNDINIVEFEGKEFVVRNQQLQ